MLPLKRIQKAKMMSEMTSVTPNYLENMYRNSIFVKKVSRLWFQSCFPMWQTAAVLNFEIQLKSVDIFFLWS